MDIVIRPARDEDFEQIVALDAAQAEGAKPDYWRSLFNRYRNRPDQRYMLVADDHGRLVGYIIGEVRAWEFGLPRSGWIFDIMVATDQRAKGTGRALFQAICRRFKADAVETIRTDVNRTDTLIMAFFRGQGMMAAPIVQLEMALDDVEGLEPQ